MCRSIGGLPVFGSRRGWYTRNPFLITLRPKRKKIQKTSKFSTEISTAVENSAAQPKSGKRSARFTLPENLDVRISRSFLFFSQQRRGKLTHTTRGFNKKRDNFKIYARALIAFIHAALRSLGAQKCRKTKAIERDWGNKKPYMR